MKKIIFQTNDMSIAGGAERVISIWANHFSDNYNIEIITGCQKKSFYNLKKNIKCKFCDFKPEFRIFPGRILEIYKYLKTLECQDTVIVNKYNWVNSVWLLKKLGLFKNINFVYFAHGGTSDFSTFYKGYRVKKIFTTFNKIICLHDDTNNYHKFVDRKKIQIISNPCIVKDENKNSNEEKNVLIVGRLSKEKGIINLLEIWNKTNKNGFSLRIAGDGPEKEIIKDKIKELSLEKSVKLLGNVKEIDKEYKAAAIYVMTSEYEGMPMVILEAMSYGLPIIAFKNQGTYNLLKNNNGILVNLDDIEEFAQCLNDLIDSKSLRKLYGAKSLKVAKNFNINIIANEFKKCLKE